MISFVQRSKKTRLSLLALFLAGAALLLLLPACSSYYDGPKSINYDGSKFFNPGAPRKAGFMTFLRWRLTGERGEWPEGERPNPYDAVPVDQVTGSYLTVTYIGHATFLIQTAGLNILTDPVFSDRASPFSFVGPKRTHKPGIQWDNLPKIDLVLISHNHYDHMDLPTLERLWERDKPRMIAPLGNDTIIQNYNEDIAVEAYDWYDQVAINDQIVIHLDPMQHWSARGLFDRNKALWAAFTVETPDGNIYFSGDTGYGDGSYFKEARSRHGEFRFAILPIGAYEPRWFMGYSHMAPDEAMKAHFDLGAPPTVASHFDVFQLTDTPYGAAREELNKLKKDFPEANFRVLEIGESWVF